MYAFPAVKSNASQGLHEPNYKTKNLNKNNPMEHPSPTVETFAFSEALAHIKVGKQVGRKEWKNAKAVFLVNGSKFVVNRPPLNVMFPEGTEVTYRAHIDMIAADGSVGTWAPSMVDLLAEDWYIVTL